MPEPEVATDITVTLTRDEAQYVLNSIDTHIKHHGLGVATMGVVVLGKLQGASVRTKDEDASVRTNDEDASVRTNDEDESSS